MKLLPCTILIALVFVSCQDSKKKVLAELQGLLVSIEAEKETYQATLTSINETQKAMLSKYLEGVRAQNIDGEIVELLTAHKRLTLNYEEVLKNYLNLIPQLNEVISQGDDEKIVALSLENSFQQLTDQKQKIIVQLDDLKTEHETYREQFEEIVK